MRRDAGERALQRLHVKFERLQDYHVCSVGLQCDSGVYHLSYRDTR